MATSQSFSLFPLGYTRNTTFRVPYDQSRAVSLVEAVIDFLASYESFLRTDEELLNLGPGEGGTYLSMTTADNSYLKLYGTFSKFPTLATISFSKKFEQTGSYNLQKLLPLIPILPLEIIDFKFSIEEFQGRRVFFLGKTPVGCSRLTVSFNKKEILFSANAERMPQRSSVMFVNSGVEQLKNQLELIISPKTSQAPAA